ncbi:MAG: hypothetical protein Q9169_006142 [Polycauliona sp. 2 TL-2023]
MNAEATLDERVHSRIGPIRTERQGVAAGLREFVGAARKELAPLVLLGPVHARHERDDRVDIRYFDAVTILVFTASSHVYIAPIHTGISTAVAKANNLPELIPTYISLDMVVIHGRVTANEDAWGPRKDVIYALDEAIDGHDQPPVGLDPLIAGKLRIHSSTTPHIQGEKQYSINVKQEIKWQTQTETLNSTQQFTVVESPYTLDDSVIRSVYPPSGHSDHSSQFPLSHRFYSHVSLEQRAGPRNEGRPQAD